jgi:hypothetical protein
MRPADAATTNLMEFKMFKLNNIAGATQKVAATACAVMALAAFAPAAQANNGITVTDYADAGLWSVKRIEKHGQFSYCRAGLTYESGIQVYMIGYEDDWRVQFYNSEWPKRKLARFEGDLLVDSNNVRSSLKFWRGNSVFIRMGKTVDSMEPLMRGKVMSVVTAAGQSHFSLKGSAKAISLTAQCRAEALAKANSKPVAKAPVTSGGAFGARPVPKQAETAPQPAPQGKPYKFNHEQTVAHAKGYLGKTPHTILAPEKNPFKHFPVNWKTNSGVIGGMMIIANTSQTIQGGLTSLAGDNAKTCKGKADVASTFTTDSPLGKKAIATTTCEMNGGTRIWTFSVIQRAPNTLMIIVEAFFQAKDPKTANTAKPKLVGA